MLENENDEKAEGNVVLNTLHKTNLTTRVMWSSIVQLQVSLSF